MTKEFSRSDRLAFFEIIYYSGYRNFLHRVLIFIFYKQESPVIYKLTGLLSYREYFILLNSGQYALPFPSTLHN